LSVLRALDLNVVALFSPEHGFAGDSEGHVASSQYATLPLHSLYGTARSPSAQMLAGIEVLICDLQDVGARFYTYISTLAHCMEECAKHDIAIVVFDRPNPLGGQAIEGPLIENELRSFIGYLDIPIRHGMTMGELALLYQSDVDLNVELRVAKILNWKREIQWPQTNLEWPVPSPNLPDFQSAAWYPGTCLLEFSKLSVGRGTNAPFQIVGAPWASTKGVLPLLRDEPIFAENFVGEVLNFTPTRGEYAGELCHGLKFSTPDGAIPISIVPLGLCLLSALHRAQPDEFDEAKMQASLPLLGAEGVLPLLRDGEIKAALEIAEKDAEEFRKRRGEFLIYD